MAWYATKEYKKHTRYYSNNKLKICRAHIIYSTIYKHNTSFQIMNNSKISYQSTLESQDTIVQSYLQHFGLLSNVRFTKGCGLLSIVCNSCRYLTFHCHGDPEVRSLQFIHHLLDATPRSLGTCAWCRSQQLNMLKLSFLYFILVICGFSSLRRKETAFNEISLSMSKY